MAPHELPIGVFDSGLGGLTVLKALREHLPSENFIYLGDVARLPYGSKSQAVVCEYARQCTRFLVGRNVKAVVIACNTASAMALEVLQKEMPVPVFGVILSGAQAGLAANQSPKSILVLATESAVRSEAYLKAFARLDPTQSVEQLACPLLVPLAEEGWFDHSVTQQVISHYLSTVDLHKTGTVVLGCTHFPLLEPSFRKVLPAHIALVHGGQGAALQVASALEKTGLRNASGLGTVSLLTTDRVSVRLPLLGDWTHAFGEAEVVHLGL